MTTPVPAAQFTPPPDPPAEPAKPAVTDPPAPEHGDDWDGSTGKGGKAAVLADLSAQRAARRAAEKERADLAARLKEFEDRDKSDLDKAVERAAAAERKVQAATARAVRAEVRALADGWADREDAVLNLGDLTKYAGKDGEVDTDAIAEELAKVLERKPHLARNGAVRAPAPDPSQGPRGPVDIDALIRDAESKGNVRESIRLKTQKLHAK